MLCLYLLIQSLKFILTCQDLYKLFPSCFNSVISLFLRLHDTLIMSLDRVVFLRHFQKLRICFIEFLIKMLLLALFMV